MSTKIPSSNPTAYVGLKETNPPQLYFRNRAPTTADYRAYDMGDIWIDQNALEAYILVLKSGGVSTWVGIGGTGAIETLTGDSGGAVSPDGLENIDLKGNTSPYDNGVQVTGDPGNNTLTFKDLRNITKYVVDPTAGETEYQTIQSALDAANAAGGGTVWIREGIYNENLTLYDKVDLWGAIGIADNATCIINGVHTPPASGTITIRNLYLQSATDILNSAVAGTSSIIIVDSQIDVTNGYVFNLPNWTGAFVYFDIGSISTNDGVVNNTAGATIFMTDATIGAGSGNTMTVSGSCTFYNVHIQCPITIQGAATSTLNGGCWLSHTLTTSATATVSCTNTLFNTGVNIAITHNSSNVLTLSQVSIKSSAANVITGTGTVKLGDVDFGTNSGITGVTIQASTLIADGPTRIYSKTSAAGNDAYVNYKIPGSTDWSVGIDNSDADKLKIGPNADPSTGTSSISVKTTGDITFNQAYEFPITDGTAGQVLITDGAGNVDWGDESSSGEVVQIVRNSTNGVQQQQTVIPYDDTIPQIGEGTQIVTVSITPTSATSILHIHGGFFWSASNNVIVMTIALFRDAVANALAAFPSQGSYSSGGQGPLGESIFLDHYMTAGTTSPITFRIRGGGSVNQFWTYGGTAGGARRYGGVGKSFITVTEYKA